MLNKLSLGFLLLSTCFLMSCGENYFFEQSIQIEKSAWDYDNQLAYTFEVTDTTKVYNLLLEIDHSTEYAYQNCYLKIHTTFPSGEKVEQVLSIDLADKIGQWQGNCNSEACTVLLDLQKKARFNALGKHQITLEQYMRMNPLRGIHSIALKLEEWQAPKS
jgi:gliding motility-associated lipoprotein GldH